MRQRSNSEVSSQELLPQEIPDFEIDSLARCLLPKIQAYFRSEEGKEAFYKWKKEKENNVD